MLESYMSNEYADPAVKELLQKIMLYRHETGKEVSNDQIMRNAKKLLKENNENREPGKEKTIVDILKFLEKWCKEKYDKHEHKK